MQSKSLTPPKGKELVSLPNVETYPRSRSRDQVTRKKEAKLNKLPPLPGPKPNGRIQVAKVVASQNIPDIHVNQKHRLGGRQESVFRNADLELNRKSRVYRGKDVSSRKGAPAYDLKQDERLCIADNAILQSSLPTFDLNQDAGHSGKETALPTRAPVFDLNEISVSLKLINTYSFRYFVSHTLFTSFTSRLSNPYRWEKRKEMEILSRCSSRSQREVQSKTSMMM